jgi:hypothetical protein
MIVTTWANSNYIKSTVTTITINHIRVAVIGVDINTSSNNNTTFNRSTRRVTTYFVYNKELAIGSIWNIVGIDRSNYGIAKLVLDF